ncbi:WhiB family transcriptional regulator [Micromonospora aurantiaca (nom. illeg.)]
MIRRQTFRIAAPNTPRPRPADWRDAAACRTEDPDLWFPAGDSGPYLATIEQAKQICRRCPVVTECLQYALDNNVSGGIFGGFTEQERRSTQRSAKRRQVPLAEAAARKAARPPKHATMRCVFNNNTAPLDGGHAQWTGSQKVCFKGQTFTPKQFAFTLDRGRAPDGRITSECGVTGCILPSHLKDQRERGVCGTRNGYQRHLREQTDICAPCRRANSEADNRLRRTGTTKQAA